MVNSPCLYGAYILEGRESQVEEHFTKMTSHNGKYLEENSPGPYFKCLGVRSTLGFWEPGKFWVRN